jgi:hypothetical protein
LTNCSAKAGLREARQVIAGRIPVEGQLLDLIELGAAQTRRDGGSRMGIGLAPPMKGP